MPYTIKVLNERNEEKHIPVDHLPDGCPVCKKAGKPIPLTGHFYTQGPPRIRVAFLCPVTECSEIFIASYYNGNQGGVEAITSTLQKTQALRTVEDIVFPASIAGLSPQFVRTFNQSHVAEVNALDQICGPGYRKSLEFLIKDFLVGYKFKGNNEMGNRVRGLFLGRCISDLIDEDRIKECAKRAAWLGNDETHYTRIWQEKDIRDLKALIQMTVNWIDLIVQSDAYLHDMPDRAEANKASESTSKPAPSATSSAPQG